VLKESVWGPWVRRWIEVGQRHAWLAPPDQPDPLPVFAEEPRECSADPSRLNRYLFDLVRHSNLPAVLAFQDRSAMAHGVENRPPFLDHRLVEWAFRLPPAAKVGGGRRKLVLWRAGHRLLPPSVLARTDKRAIVSRRDWMPLRTVHREALLAMADSPVLRSAPSVQADRLTQFVHAYLRGDHNDGMSVWRLYTGWRWLEHFGPA